MKMAVAGLVKASCTEDPSPCKTYALTESSTGSSVASRNFARSTASEDGLKIIRKATGGSVDSAMKLVMKRG